MGNTYQPIRWVVVRTTNFTGNMFVEELCQRRNPAYQRMLMYERFDIQGDFQYEVMRTDEAYRRGVKGVGVTE